MDKTTEIRSILQEAKEVAKKYRKLTGKPLGITGEVAEFTAATLLGLDLAEARQSGELKVSGTFFDKIGSCNQVKVG